MRYFVVLVVLALLSGLTPIGDENECSCEQGRTRSIWCVLHGVGRVAGVEIRSKLLFETLDAHGHELNVDGLRCAACRFAARNDAWCGDDHLGFVNGQAYFSKLTWLLAKGEPIDPGTLECAVCRAQAECRTLPLTEDGWCEACGAGMVGNVRFRDRETFNKARRQFERLLRAVEKSAECEGCAAAMFYDGRCPICRIEYKDGKPVEPATGSSPTPPGS